jgi:hypothetical protein
VVSTPIKNLPEPEKPYFKTAAPVKAKDYFLNILRDLNLNYEVSEEGK